MDVPELSQDLIELRGISPQFDAARYAVVHVGASDPRRRWPIEQFAAVVDHLSRAHQLSVVATGSDSDRALVRQLADAVVAPIFDLSGKTSLGALAALVRRAKLVVSNDTGVSNLAIAVNTPSVVVYWCGNVITAGPFYRGRHRPVLSWTVECPSCGQRQCTCPVSFVADARLEEVLSQVDDLLRPDIRYAPTALLQ
jgi:ADP-heptose:LPS heptosyltransferase